MNSDVIKDFERLFGREPLEDNGLCQINAVACGRDADKVKFWFEDQLPPPIQEMDGVPSTRIKDGNGNKMEIPGLCTRKFRYMQDGYEFTQHIGRRAGYCGCLLELPVDRYADIKWMVFRCMDTEHRFPVRFGIMQEKRAASFAVTFDADEGVFSMETIRENENSGEDDDSFSFNYYATDAASADEAGYGLIHASEGNQGVIEYMDTLEIPGGQMPEGDETGIFRGFPIPTAGRLAQDARCRKEASGNKILEDFERLFGRKPLPGSGLCLLGFSVYCQYQQFDLNFHFEKRDGTRVEAGDMCMGAYYPNKCYRSVHQRVGRKVAKYGYYLELPLEEFGQVNCLVLAIDGFSYSFPIRLSLTEEKHIAIITMTFCSTTEQFAFFVLSDDDEDEGYVRTEYVTDKSAAEKRKCRFLSGHSTGKVKPKVIFDDLIEIPGRMLREDGKGIFPGQLAPPLPVVWDENDWDFVE